MILQPARKRRPSEDDSFIGIRVGVLLLIAFALFGILAFRLWYMQILSGDEYVNEIIEQGLRVNPKLKIVLVSPNATSLIQTVPILNDNPRVITIAKPAREALDQGEVKTTVRKLLKESKEEEPF